MRFSISPSSCLLALWLAIVTLVSPSCERLSRCGAEPLSKEELRAKVEAHFERTGTRLPANRHSEVTVKRDHCDYLYMEETIPPAPGFHFLVRLNRKGEVIEVLQGR